MNVSRFVKGLNYMHFAHFVKTLRSDYMRLFRFQSEGIQIKSLSYWGLQMPHSRVPIIGKNFTASGEPKPFFDCQNQITIGDTVFFGHGVKILTGYHEYDKVYEQKRLRTIKSKPVAIGDGVWVASFSIILPGVHIGKNSVVGAGSVVTKDIPDHELWAGNPARKIKNI